MNGTRVYLFNRFVDVLEVVAERSMGVERDPFRREDERAEEAASELVKEVVAEIATPTHPNPFVGDVERTIVIRMFDVLYRDNNVPMAIVRLANIIKEFE